MSSIVGSSHAQASAAGAGPRSAALPLVAAHGLHRWFDMGRTRVRVLTDCSLEVRAGEFLSIMGKSGSGKSTLLHILGALDVPQEGQVMFDGEPVFAPPARRRTFTTALDVFSTHERRRCRLRRRAFGFVFQFYHLLPELNVLENVTIARMVGASMWTWPRVAAAARNDAIAVLERVGLGDRLKHRPSELSGGERQRVAIARALAHRPRLLLADEPTGNLDSESGAALMALLHEIHAQGQTIVLVTHDSGIASQAERILRLENGALRMV